MSELMDIVDEDDNVIGFDTRENVHDGYHIHRGVHVLVLNSQNAILVQKRSSSKSDRPGHFDASVGAQVQTGESYEDAAIRESREELGFEPGELTPIAKYKSFSKRQREIRMLFVCYAEGPFSADPAEIESLHWMTTEEILSKHRQGVPFTDGFLKSLEHLATEL